MIVTVHRTAASSADAGTTSTPVVDAPHSSQNVAVGERGCWQVSQTRAAGVPHSPQDFAFSLTSPPPDVQFTPHLLTRGKPPGPKYPAQARADHFRWAAK